MLPGAKVAIEFWLANYLVKWILLFEKLNNSFLENVIEDINADSDYEFPSIDYKEKTYDIYDKKKNYILPGDIIKAVISKKNAALGEKSFDEVKSDTNVSVNNYISNTWFHYLLFPSSL